MRFRATLTVAVFGIACAAFRTSAAAQPQKAPDVPVPKRPNVLLILVPLMPSLRLATIVLLVRFSISQMDVPTRQSYTMAVVSPEERSAAAGITGVARTTGAAISPLFVGFMFARPALINAPFFIAGTLKIIYDILLYKQFVGVRPPEESR